MLDNEKINMNMVIRGQNVMLRDLIKADMEDYHKWFFYRYRMAKMGRSLGELL